MNYDNEDPLDRLKENWEAIPTPQFEDGDDKPRDPETRDCVGWMQDAWQQIEVPQFAPTPRRLRFTPFLRVSSSVAAAIVVASITIWSFGGATSAKGNPKRSDENGLRTMRNQSTVEVAESGTMTTTIREQGGLLLRKGRVRLILVQPTIIHTTTDKESRNEN